MSQQVQHVSWQAGFGVADITVFEPGMAMLGWGLPDHIPKGAAHPLRAKAMAVRRSGRTIVYLVADLCFISASLRIGVLDALAARGCPVEPCDLMLTATHTHSGPNGFSHAFFYDMSALGFSHRVYDRLVEGMLQAILRAIERLEPATVRLGAAQVRGDVLTNRSPGAYRRNPEARGEGVDRELLVLRVDALGGRAIGAVSFFALHATSVHSDGAALHPDHKGIAAARFERWARGRGASSEFVAMFAQGAAGDVSPNVRWDSTRRRMVGPGQDDEASATRVADAQVDATAEAFERASVLTGPLDAALLRADFERRFVPGVFNGGTPARTSLAQLGLAMAKGTREGPGPLGSVPVPRRFTRDDPKLTMLRVGPGVRRRLFGHLDPRQIQLPHPIFEHVQRSEGLLGAWIPTVLPVQLLRLGSFVIAALPNEPTTTSGHRLRARIKEALGVERVHVQGYANAYSGYLTTPEEYRAQRYEGAYTLFGPHTLGAFAEVLSTLCGRLSGEPKPVEGPPLQRSSDRVLRSRAFALTATHCPRCCDLGRLS